MRQNIFVGYIWPGDLGISIVGAPIFFISNAPHPAPHIAWQGRRDITIFVNGKILTHQALSPTSIYTIVGRAEGEEP